MNNWKKKLRPLFLDWSSEHTTECQRKHREDIERSDLRFQSTNESFEVFLKNVEGYIENEIKNTRERTISHIAHYEGWEETGDKYRKEFGLKEQYKKTQ